METINGVTLQDVDSSLLSHAGYDAAKQQLYCKFKSTGALWRYDDVSPFEWGAMSSSKSMGHYFLTQIKGKKTSLKVG
jgi:hypothetical protein